MSRRPSRQTVAVLAAMAADPADWRYGYELGREVGLKAGSLYSILMRLGDRGLLESTWGGEPPAGRPPRHLYRLNHNRVTSPAGRPPASPLRLRPPLPRRHGSRCVRPGARDDPRGRSALDRPAAPGAPARVGTGDGGRARREIG